jgi:Putative 2OG-Fe(II) oxygenase
MEATPSQASKAETMASEAVLLLRGGDIEAGKKLLAKALRHDERPPAKIPAGYHLSLLERHLDANALRHVTSLFLRAGTDISLGLALGHSPAERLAEYRGLLAVRRMNSTMVMNYLSLLNQLGDADTMAPFLDAHRLVRRIGLDIADRPDVLREAADVLLARCDDETWAESMLAIRKLHRITNLGGLGSPAIDFLLGRFRAEVEQYLAAMREGHAVIAGLVPENFELVSWALVSLGDGVHAPHVHPHGMFNGVFYLTAPDDVGDDGLPSGALRVGNMFPRTAQTARWPDLVFAPVPGTLILMPSYFKHWTVPLVRPGLRIAMAFDVVPIPRA